MNIFIYDYCMHMNIFLCNMYFFYMCMNISPYASSCKLAYGCVNNPNEAYHRTAVIYVKIQHEISYIHKNY